MSGRAVRCALLANYRNDWAAAITLACGDLEFVTLDRRTLGLADAPNPFGLGEDDRADVVLLTSYWCEWLITRHPDRFEAVMRTLERSAAAIIGLDGSDHFELGFRPRMLGRLATILKFQGVFRDRDLYNYDVGPWPPGAVWSQKKRPKPARYREEDLDRIRLSVPCLMMDLPGLLRAARRYETGAVGTLGKDMARTQRWARNVGEEILSAALLTAPVARRPLEVHCVATLTQVQRLDAMRLLQGFTGLHGIDRVLSTVAGTGESADGRAAEDYASMLRRDAAPFLVKRVGRLRYVRDMVRHRIVVAPAGYGELGQRHAWALRTGAVLVCQDLGHVDTMFTFRHRENTMFCRPDLSDLTAVVRELLEDDGLRCRIAREGRRAFAAWGAKWRSHLETGIANPVRETVKWSR